MTGATWQHIPLFALTAALISLRLFAATLALPGLGGPTVPRGGRIFLTLALAASFTLGARPPSVLDPSLAMLAVSAGRELLVGAVMGLCFSIPLYGLRSAGELIGGTMGLGFAQSADPITGVQDTTMGRLYGTLGALAFLVADGPRVVLQFIAWSLQVLPVGDLSLPALGLLVSQLGQQLFDIAIRVAAPPLVAVLVAQMMIGLVGRASPALNVFAVGFGIALAVGGVAVFLSWSGALPVFEDALRQNILFGAELLRASGS